LQYNDVNISLQEIIEKDKKYYMHTFGDRTPVCFEYGKGIDLWDIEGRKFHDFLGGIAVNILGHSHPKLVYALQEQASKFIHCSSLYYIKQQALLAEVLVTNSCADKVFFANSGAEANEGAIKLARIFFKKKGIDDKFEIITLEKSFHGRTLATIAATGQEKYKKPFSPLMPSFINVPINDLKALENAVCHNTCAVMLEPIQGESGVNEASVEFLKGVRQICDQNGILLIYDEVQCGLGRTGKLFAYEHSGVEPDIFTLAKGLGGGFPIGALCAKEFAAEAFAKGDHGSTFGGNPFACSAGLAVMDVLLNDGLVENSRVMGEYLMSKLMGLKGKYNGIREIRGKGLMIAVQFAKPSAETIKNSLFNEGYLVGSVGDDIIRLLPPLILNKSEADEFIVIFNKVLEGILHETSD